MALRVGNYVTTYDETDITYSPEESERISKEIKEKVAKQFEKIIKKAKNYSIYFYQIMQSQLLDSKDDDNLFYGLFFSRMRMEIDMNMDAAAAVGFDLYTKTKIAEDTPGLSNEEREKAKQGALYKTLNTEEYFIVFNPLKMALFSREERIAVLKHEIHHMLRLHHLRMFDETRITKPKEEIMIENIVLDKEINGTFDKPGILHLPGTKGHVPHVYPAVVKESYFLPAYKQGLITEKEFEEILSTDISAEKMKKILLSIKEKQPDFFNNPPTNQDNQKNNQKSKNNIKGHGQQGQGYGKESIEKSDGLNGVDDIENIPDDNLSPNEMRERIEEMKKQIRELDEILNKGKGENTQSQKSDKNQGQQNQQGQDKNNQCNNKAQGQNNNSQSQSQNGSQSKNRSEVSSKPNNNQIERSGSSESDLKKEYDRLVNELAKKMAEAYLKGLLKGGIDKHDQFVRNIPKGLEKEVAKRKAIEKMEDMITKTKEEFDFRRPKSRGYMPQEFQTAYENVINLLRPQNNYKHLLRHYLRKAEGLKSGKKSTWDRRSIIEPFNPNIKGKKKTKKPPIALIIDVSGSMSDAEVLAAYGELIGIIQEEVKNGGAALRVIQADTIVTLDEFLENPKKKDIAKIMKRTGSGGTYMEPAIKRALGIGESIVELPNGEKVKISNKKLLNKKSLGVRPKTIFVVTDGWIENEFEEIVPYGMPKDNNQSYLPPDVEIIWIVTGDFGKNPEMARKKAEKQLAFNYKQYGNQMKVIAIDIETIMQELQRTKKINGPDI